MTSQLIKSSPFVQGLISTISATTLLMGSSPMLAQMTPPTSGSTPSPTSIPSAPAPEPSTTPAPATEPSTNPVPATEPSTNPSNPTDTTSSPSGGTDSLLRLGSKGEAVRQVQTLLKQKGFYQGSVNGVFGQQTRKAVMAFQKSKNLAVDGVVGPQTLAAMNQSGS